MTFLCKYCKNFSSRFYSKLLKHIAYEHQFEPDFRIKCHLCLKVYTVVSSYRYMLCICVHTYYNEIGHIYIESMVLMLMMKMAILPLKVILLVLTMYLAMMKQHSNQQHTAPLIGPLLIAKELLHYLF